MCISGNLYDAIVLIAVLAFVGWLWWCWFKRD